MKKLITRIRDQVRQQKRGKRVTNAVTLIAAFSVFLVVYVLILPALALEEEAYCGLEAHEHSDACYQQVLICDKEEHTHTDECYDEDGSLICGKDEHSHDKECYKDELICGREKHIHDESCYSKPEPEEISKDSTQIQEEITEASAVGAEDKTGEAQTETKENTTSQKEKSTQAENVPDTAEEAERTEEGIAEGRVSLNDFLSDRTGMWVQRVKENQEIVWVPVTEDTTLTGEDLVRLHLAFKLPRKTLTDAAASSLSEYIYRLPEDMVFTEGTAAWHNDDTNAVNQVITGIAQPDRPAVTEEYLAGKYQLAHDEKEGWELIIRWDPYIISENSDKAVNVWTELYITGESLSEPDGKKEEPEKGKPDKSDKTDNTTEAEPKEESADRVLTYEGKDYSITVTYGKEAKLPGDVELNVREIREDSGKRAEKKEYDSYYRQAESAVREKQCAVTGARFFDLTFMDGGKEMEPAAPVIVKITYDDTESIKEDEDVVAVHLPEKADSEVLSTDVVKDGKDLKEVEFAAESFSVYGIVYTVDFHWEINGKMYDFSIPGGGFVSLEHVVEVLGIATADENTENEAEKAENDTENGNDFVGEVPGVDVSGENGTTYEEAIKLNEVEVSEATKKFVADVESVEFSSPELVWVGKVDKAATVGGLKETNGLEVEYSAELTEERIAEINAQTVEAGDWALISVQPFASEETLTITMKNGDQWTVKVTDAQISTHVITADGKDYIITVTYNDAAQIPEEDQTPASDTLLYSEADSQAKCAGYALLSAGMFALYRPMEQHMPCVHPRDDAPTQVEKLVFKARL